MRLVRTILLLACAGFLLPSPPEDVAAQNAGTPVGEQVSTLGMLSSATSAVSDVAGFCSRQPEVCTTATYLAGRLEAKAKYSAKLIYEWASDATSDPAIPAGKIEAEKVDQLKTGSARFADAAPPPPAAQSTLKIEDLIPEWRGPKPKPAQGKPEKKEG